MPDLPVYVIVRVDGGEDAIALYPSGGALPTEVEDITQHVRDWSTIHTVFERHLLGRRNSDGRQP